MQTYNVSEFKNDNKNKKCKKKMDIAWMAPFFPGFNSKLFIVFLQWFFHHGYGLDDTNNSSKIINLLLSFNGTGKIPPVKDVQ